jgi:uncharacterized membrane protein YphA (DoxX/SURF4 family)
MVEAFERTLPTTDRSGGWWLQFALRFAVAWLVVGPAVSKFFTHGRSVAFFASLGIPYPTATVLLAGAVEVAAVALLVVGVGDDLAALALVPVMLVAVVFSGPDWKNLAVRACCRGLLARNHERLRGRYRWLAAAVSPD